MGLWRVYIMPSSANLVRAAIVLLGLKDSNCFTSMQEFIEALPELIGVEIPDDITNVVVSNIQPSDSQTTDVWFRLTNGGSFVSINVFSQGQWHPIYPVNVATSPEPTLQIFWLQGDSSNPPPGFQNTNDAPGVDPAIATALAALWITGAGSTEYYSACFTGF